jgi:hypothetical protein
VSNHSQRAGRIEADVSLSDPKTTTGRLAFGRDSTDAYYSIGLGRGEFAYTAYQYIPGRAWVPLKLQGVSSNLTANRLYHVEVTFRGRRAWLRVDGATVFSVDLPTPLRGGQVGVFAFGPSPARFENFRAVGEMPQAFVVMQFGNPYDALYKNIIRPVARKKRFDPTRADELHRRGIIVEDIVRSLREAEVVIAEITEKNANVFYELGYAHAMGKRVIFLANQDRLDRIPFDVAWYRVIFYDEMTRGRRKLGAELRKHLQAIVEEGGPF